MEPRKENSLSTWHLRLHLLLRQRLDVVELQLPLQVVRDRNLAKDLTTVPILLFSLHPDCATTISIGYPGNIIVLVPIVQHTDPHTHHCPFLVHHTLPNYLLTVYFWLL